MQTSQLDIFVASAMFFSTTSAMISISQQVSRKMKQESEIHTSAKFFYRAKRTFKMKIECSKFERHHQYTHRLIEKTICSVLGIDNAGNIEVFYIIPIRHAIIAYMEVSNINIDSTGTVGNTNNNTMDGPGGTGTVPSLSPGSKETVFVKLKRLATHGDVLNEAFKHDLSKKLRLFRTKRRSSKRLSQIQPGAEMGGNEEMFDSSSIKIMIEEDKHGLSVDTTTVDIRSSAKLKNTSNGGSGGSVPVTHTHVPQLSAGHFSNSSVKSSGNIGGNVMNGTFGMGGMNVVTPANLQMSHVYSNSATSYSGGPSNGSSGGIDVNNIVGIAAMGANSINMSGNVVNSFNAKSNSQSPKNVNVGQGFENGNNRGLTYVNY